MAEIPERRWCLHLQALLTSELITVSAQLSAEDAKDYQTVKAKLLERFQLTSDSARIKFRSVEKSNDQTFPDFAFLLRTHLNSWLKLSKIKTLEELVDLVAMEHFMNKCPPYVKYWLQDKGPQAKIEATALLAEEYVVRRRANQAEATNNGTKPKELNSGNSAKNGNQNGKPPNGQRNNGQSSNDKRGNSRKTEPAQTNNDSSVKVENGVSNSVNANNTEINNNVNGASQNQGTSQNGNKPRVFACWNCGSPEHRAQQCTQPKRSNPASVNVCIKNKLSKSFLKNKSFLM